MTYNAHITQIKNVRAHPNADKLLLGECFGSQVVVGLHVKEDDIGVYFPTDGRLEPGFLEANNLVRKLDAEGKNIGGMFDENGRVRTQKFRGEKSDGYFSSLESLSYTGIDITTLTPGIAFNELNGNKICDKYITTNTRSFSPRVRKDRPKDNYPLFHKHVDTEQLAYNLAELNDGDILTITEKVHGTSGRTSHTLKVTQSKIGSIVNSIFKKTIVKPKHEWDYICGSRNVTLTNLNNCVGFYGDDDSRFRSEAHALFVGKLHKGENVYYEIVGWSNETSPLMPTCQNSKLKDKEFTKKYGKETTFHYGCPPGTNDVYVYRMSITNEDGVETDYDYNTIVKRCSQLGVKVVPHISTIQYTKYVYSDGQTLLKLVDDMVSRESIITPAHIMEGVVVRINSTEWKAFKYKSYEFRVIEGIIKDTGVVDLEEAS